jgi:hypothetical protein
VSNFVQTRRTYQSIEACHAIPAPADLRQVLGPDARSDGNAAARPNRQGHYRIQVYPMPGHQMGEASSKQTEGRLSRRPRQSLRTTPAVALGIAVRAWTVGDLLDARWRRSPLIRL